LAASLEGLGAITGSAGFDISIREKLLGSAKGLASPLRSDGVDAANQMMVGRQLKVSLHPGIPSEATTMLG
jgi:hypothetical protein